MRQGAAAEASAPPEKSKGEASAPPERSKREAPENRNKKEASQASFNFLLPAELLDIRPVCFFYRDPFFRAFRTFFLVFL